MKHLVNVIKRIICKSNKMSAHHAGQVWAYANVNSPPSPGNVEDPNNAFAPGNFYSPIHSIKDVDLHDFEMSLSTLREFPGIELNTEQQLKLLETFEMYYDDWHFPTERNKSHRYYSANSYFSGVSGVFLYCMLRHLQPKKVIEIGSGFSSALMLDINDAYFDKSISLTFIEPYPNRLKGLLKPEDKGISLIEKRLQEVPITVFDELQANDLLFIDSSHVSKFNSDVNYQLHELLPRLKNGVYIHFHDILYPFEYPKKWLSELGWSWNEAYILRAFLQYNAAFKIALWQPYIYQFFANKINNFPMKLGSTSSMYLRKEENIG